MSLNELTGGKGSLLHVQAWPLYLVIWTIFHFIDYKLRNPEILLIGGMNEAVFSMLSLISLANFVVMIILVTESVSNLWLRSFIIIVHTSVCIVVTLFLMVYYAVGILGDTI